MPLRLVSIGASLVVFGVLAGALLLGNTPFERQPTGLSKPAATIPLAEKRRAYNAVLDHLSRQPSFSIVQIGAYIGDTDNDPLYRFLSDHLDAGTAAGEGRSIQVVLVEPIREYFDLLRKNYSHVAHIEFENAAIAESAGEKQMYRLNVDPVEYGYPAWLSQLSSLKKERMEALWDYCEKEPRIKQFYLDHRIVEKVRCMTLQQLLAKHHIRHLDLLQVDTEGYDYQILKTIDFSQLKPRFINYERVLLKDDEPACRAMLEGQGYLLIDWGQDTLAILTN